MSEILTLWLALIKSDFTSVLQDIRQEACHDSETDRIFIPFKDSNFLFNAIFQDCVKKLFYRNSSETLQYLENNEIDKEENFWGPSRIKVKVVYQDKNPEAEDTQLQTESVDLSPEQVKSCSEPDQLSLTSTALIIAITSAGLIFFIIIIVSLIVIFTRRKKSRKLKTGVDTNPEYGADYYYKQNQETYEEEVQYVT